MTQQPTSSQLADEIAAALQWWREAGVEYDFTDEASGWLEAEAPQGPDASATAPPPPRPVPERPPIAPQVSQLAKIGGDRAGWPTEFGAFAEWWLGEKSLDQGGINPRIAPVGNQGAKLMLLVEQPEAEDSDHLLSGPQGRLLGNMLLAMGLEREQCYIASALPRHMPLPDWPALHGAELAEITAHHIALARPERILAFGRNILPLLGHDMAQDPAALQLFNHEGTSIPALAAGSLESLLVHAGRRARFWRRWLEWTDDWS
ncbi:MAG: uracil-DNA glycosylase family protein [Sphingomonadaceae bacterium]|nr:hypothetical protein [Sphingomonadaceae bacterium]